MNSIVSVAHACSYGPRLCSGNGSTSAPGILTSAPTKGKPRRANSNTTVSEAENGRKAYYIMPVSRTWNVGGKLPPDDLEMKDWLGMAEPVDIYVLCLQEIVPLNAGNIFGAEDNKPVSRWECLIRRALNKIQPAKLKYKSYSNPSSPSRYQPSDDNLCFEDALLQGSDSETDEEAHQLVEDSHDFDSSYSHTVGSAKLSGNTISRFTNDDSIRSQDSGHQPLSSRKMFKKSHCSSFKNHPLASVASMTEQKRLTRTLSCSDRIGLLWPEQQLDILAELSLDGSNTFMFSENPNYFKSVNQNCRGFAGSSLLPVLKMDDAVKKKKRSSFVRIISKQMVGVYLSIWVRRSLRKHIQNLKVSTVGVGAMGYIGNKMVELTCSIKKHLLKRPPTIEILRVHDSLLLHALSCGGGVLIWGVVAWLKLVDALLLAIIRHGSFLTLGIHEDIYGIPIVGGLLILQIKVDARESVHKQREIPFTICYFCLHWVWKCWMILDRGAFETNMVRGITEGGSEREPSQLEMGQEGASTSKEKASPSPLAVSSYLTKGIVKHAGMEKSHSKKHSLGDLTISGSFFVQVIIQGEDLLK
ncbi:Type I inositol 1,4,5-trisphosphate 5-phosphatase 1 [Platanthera zijinensis]|uniref:Type I inositol 1,4,5-trisphosphate 5-phosphatase 1 n=1 Tax=Platanthera zijinensis TaxID=2320716 RepID=A0AAP0B7R5_9ASPA